MNFVEKLNECSDFRSIFELVKSAVENTIGKKRVGLVLGLTDLPSFVGAFHQVGSNFIVMNKRLLNEVLETGNAKLINAYIFHILLHEYIHSLGFLNEQETSILTYEISKKFFGEEHPTTLIARYGIGYFLSSIERIEFNEPEEIESIEIIEDIETDNLSYFG